MLLLGIDPCEHFLLSCTFLLIMTKWRLMQVECIRKSVSTCIPAHKETCPFSLMTQCSFVIMWQEVTKCFTLFYEPFLIPRNSFHCMWVCFFSVLFIPSSLLTSSLMATAFYLNLTLAWHPFSRFWLLHKIQSGKDIKFKVWNCSPLSKFKFLHVDFPSERGQPFQESWCNK